MDILDDHRIDAITPFFVLHGLQDLIPQLREELLNIRLQQKDNEQNYKYKINNFEVKFHNSFNEHCSSDTKLIILNRIKNKYNNVHLYSFDAMINDMVNELKSRHMFDHDTVDEYFEGINQPFDKLENYPVSHPILEFVCMSVSDELPILQFSIMVIVNIDGSAYSIDTGTLYIDWDY